jgi:hypothetical protein
LIISDNFDYHNTFYSSLYLFIYSVSSIATMKNRYIEFNLGQALYFMTLFERISCLFVWNSFHFHIPITQLLDW